MALIFTPCSITGTYPCFLVSPVTLSEHKAYKESMRNLNKAKQVFQDNLGMEIRKVHGKDCSHKIFSSVQYCRYVATEYV